MGTVLLLSITHNHISSHQSKKQCSIHTGIPVVPNMVGVFGILNSLKEGVIDFHGQMLCTVLVYAIPAAGALVGVVAGYQNQDFGMTLKCVVSSTLLSLAVCVPSWPFYSRNQIKWKVTKSNN